MTPVQGKKISMTLAITENQHKNLEKPPPTPERH
jgi:hypothetical protein